MAPIAGTQDAVAPSTPAPPKVTPLVPNSGSAASPSTAPGSGTGASSPLFAYGAPLTSASNASSSSIVLPASLVGILIIIAMIVLALFINPGRATSPAFADGRTFWYSRFADSDQHVLVASSRWMGKAHRLGLITWRRGAATASWLLGR